VNEPMEITGFSGLQAVFGGTIATWKAKIKAGLPVKSEPGLRSGKARIFDSIEVYGWLIRNEPARLACGELDKNQEQAQLFKIQAERQALALAREKTELIPATVVERVWAGFTTAARGRLLTLPSRLAAQCHEQSFSAVECHAREIVYEALNEIADYDPQDYV
jgi:phage terminase Nu1 subunit (DNA packaging protein)